MEVKQVSSLPVAGYRAARQAEMRTRYRADAGGTDIGPLRGVQREAKYFALWKRIAQ